MTEMSSHGASGHAAADEVTFVEFFRDELRAKELEIEDLHVHLRRAQITGVAVGVLLASTPGWTESDAWDAWDDACERFAKDGNIRALAAHVIGTGQLP
jgi:hypothetical protein